MLRATNTLVGGWATSAALVLPRKNRSIPDSPRDPTTTRSAPDGGSWTFLTNHAHVLICLAGDPTLRIRDLAVWVGITERAVHRILSELAASGYVTRVRDGRRNHYHLDLDLPMRHVLERSHPVRNLTGAITEYPVDRGGPQ